MRTLTTSKTHPEQELETAEEQIVDQATAALTIAELEEEIRTLRGLGV